MTTDLNTTAERFGRFIAVGIFATVVNYACFAVLLSAGVDYRLSSMVGFLSGVAVGFPFNRNWTFRAAAESSDNLQSKFAYLLVYASSLVLSLVLLDVLVGMLGLTPLVANFFCIGFTTITNFVGTSWVFGKKKELPVAQSMTLLQVVKDPFFLFVSCLKLLAAATLSSDYMLKLFMPFLNAFAATPTFDIYDQFASNGLVNVFPYPAGMLYVVGSLQLVLGVFGFEHLGTHLQLIVYRLPLLAADFLILITLLNWLPQQSRRVFYFYWASPVLFYITYVHGQLDVVPMALLLVALRFLFKERIFLAAVFFGLAVATKTHIGIALPIMLLYLWRRSIDAKTIVSFVVIASGVFLLVNAPFFGSMGFVSMVFQNQEQQKIWDAALSFAPHGPQILIVPAVYIFLLIVALRLPVQNRDITLMFLGVFFGTLLLLVPPMPGWYFWVLPFFVYFFVRSSNSHFLLFFALQLAYFVFFLVRQGGDVPDVFKLVDENLASSRSPYDLLLSFGFAADRWVNVAFTGLQTLLGANCLWLWWRGIETVKATPLWSRSFVLALAGDSGSGKTTISADLEALFTSQRLTVICGDDMHRWPRGHEGWSQYTHLNPKGNELHLELQYVKALRQNKIVYRRHYDHATGDFTQPLAIKPRSIVVFEGLHPYFLQPARELIDLKVFIKPDPELLLHWKIQRDILTRGYSKEQVLKSYHARRSDAQAFVEVQEQVADLIVCYAPKNPIGDRLGEPGFEPDSMLTIVLSNRFWLDPLLESLSDCLGSSFEHSYDSDVYQRIQLKTPMSLEALREIGMKHVPELIEFGADEPDWQEGWGGTLQLFIAYLIFHESERSPYA